MKNILLIFGGDSAESEVSILTAAQVEEMNNGNFKIFSLLVRNGKLYLCKDKICPKVCALDDLPKNKFKQVSVFDGCLYLVKKNSLTKLAKIDCAILACHGGYGENGELVSMLNLSGIPTSVGNSSALMISMDKTLSKSFFNEIGVNCLPGFWFDKIDWDNNKKVLIDKINKLGFPIVVKPARQGSSVGVSFVRSMDNLDDAVELAIVYDDKVLIESGLGDFREFNVSVISFNDKIVISEIEEPVREGAILSFKDKYLSGGKTNKFDTSKKLGIFSCGKNDFDFVNSENEIEKCLNIDENANNKHKKHVFLERSKNTDINKIGMSSAGRNFPAELDGELVKQIKSFAKLIVEKLEFYGVCRIDFLVSGDKVFVNEINAIPGSLAFYFWNVDDFLDLLVCGACSNNVRKKVVPVAKFLN